MPRFTAALTRRFIPPHEVTPETFDVLIPVATVTAKDMASASARLAPAVDDAVEDLRIGLPCGYVLVRDDDAIVATSLVPKRRKPHKRHPGPYRIIRNRADAGDSASRSLPRWATRKRRKARSSRRRVP